MKPPRNKWDPQATSNVQIPGWKVGDPLPHFGEIWDKTKKDRKPTPAK